MHASQQGISATDSATRNPTATPARARAARTPAGELTPREPAFKIHQRFGHQLPLAERLAELDDEYDILEYRDGTPAQVDADVTAEARRLAQHPRAPTEPADAPG